MDVENFKRLFLPLHPKLFRIAYALVENKADAEDILQDAYYKLWSRRNELTDIQNPEDAGQEPLPRFPSLTSCQQARRRCHRSRHSFYRFFTGRRVGKTRQSTANPPPDRPPAGKSAASSPVERDRRLFDGRDRTDHRPECRQHTGATLPGTKNNPGTT